MDLAAVRKRYEDKKIGVLMGGMSSEREISLRSGENIHQTLISLGFNAVKIDVSRDLPFQLKKESIDIAFIVLHGRYGEDGAVQGLLEMMDIPYTGPGILGSALGMSKAATKKVLAQSGIPVPGSISVDPYSIERTIALTEEKFGFPCVVKANGQGSSIGVYLIFDKKELTEKLPVIIKEYPDAFIEQFVKGREVTVGVLGSSTGIEVLPILGLAPKKNFYDFEAKYTKGLTEFEIPARLPAEIQSKIEEYSIRAFRELQLKGVVRFDAIIDEHGTPYFLEVNTVPGMTDTSDVPAMARARGSFEEIVVRILDGALEG